MKEKSVKKFEPLVGRRMREGYRDSRWLEKKVKILKRDKNKCQVCNSPFCLKVHHTYYESNKPVWGYPDKSLITLCKSCHKMAHTIRIAIEDYSGTEHIGILKDMRWAGNSKQKIEVDPDDSAGDIYKNIKPKELDKVTINWIEV